MHLSKGSKHKTAAHKIAETQTVSHRAVLTETVELGVLVPYPEEGSEARDQRRPSVLQEHNPTQTWTEGEKKMKNKNRQKNNNKSLRTEKPSVS